MILNNLHKFTNYEQLFNKFYCQCVIVVSRIYLKFSLFSEQNLKTCCQITFFNWHTKIKM